jgi:hypothetical protein
MAGLYLDNFALGAYPVGYITVKLRLSAAVRPCIAEFKIAMQACLMPGPD